MNTGQKFALKGFGAFAAAVLAMSWVHTSAQTVKMPADPGVRGGAAGAGAPLKGLTADETAFFQNGLVRFAEIEVVTGGANNGLGPRFNSNSACLATRSRLWGDRALSRTPRSQLPLSMGQKTWCPGSSRKMVPSGKCASSGIRMEPMTAACTTSSSSLAA